LRAPVVPISGAEIPAAPAAAAADTKFCIDCGKPIPARAKFCAECGKPQ